MAGEITAPKLVAEFVGTYLLVLTVGCNVLSANAVWAGVSIACVLMVSIYALGAISGANFNPAVSVTLALSKLMGGNGIELPTMGAYVGVQILAGIAAAFSYSVLFWDNFQLSPAKGFSWWEAGLCETLYTFMLCFVVLNVAAAKKYDAPNGNQFYGLAIGFVIVAGAYGAGAVSGGCFNPAVAIGIDASSFGKGFGWCVAYTIFELVGAVLAAGLFKVVRPGDFSAGSEPGLPQKLTSEFLGTFILVLTVCLNVLGKSPAGAYSIAASLMCMIYALGDVSGAHFNPAVTLAIFGTGYDKDLSPKNMALYMLSQCMGGVVASFTASAIYHGKAFGLGPNDPYGWVEVGFAEVIFTAVLCTVVLAVACHEKGSPVMFGLAIGSCVTVGGFAIGAISGGSLNPAVSVGIAAANIMQGGLFYKALIYSVFEFVGAGLSAGIFAVTHGLPGKKEESLA